MQAQEGRLWSAESLFVEMINVIFTVIILAHSDLGLRWTLTLLNAPNIDYPVWIKCVDASRFLAYNQIDDFELL